jgi:hypothetical protein
VRAAPDVVVASYGTAWATRQDNRTGGGDVYVASLLPTATAWTTNTKVSDDSTTSGLDKSPRVGLTSANLPVVAWLDGRSTYATVRMANQISGGTWNASVMQDATVGLRPVEPSSGSSQGELLIQRPFLLRHAPPRWSFMRAAVGPRCRHPFARPVCFEWELTRGIRMARVPYGTRAT